MKHLGLAAGLAALLSSGAAMGADINDSLKDGADIFSAPKEVSWTGFYVGVQGGYGNANHRIEAEQITNAYEVEATPSVCTVSGSKKKNGSVKSFEFSETNVPAEKCVDSNLSDGINVSYTPAQTAYVVPQQAVSAFLDGINSSGFIGGGRVGFDLARGRFLVGVFGAYDFTNMETEAGISGLGAVKLEKQDEWTAGVRAGLIVAPRTLVYGLVGYTETSYKLLDAEKDFQGITAGGGIEFALSSNVFLGLEYTHTFYDKKTVFSASNEYGSLKVTDELDEDKVMATLKLKLNGLGLEK